MHHSRKKLYSLLTTFVLCFLAACGNETTTTVTNNSTPTAGSAEGTSTTTAQFPATQTACPDAKKARAMVKNEYASGVKDTLIYLYNEGATVNPETAVIRRFDPQNAAKVDILTTKAEYISEAHVNKEWIFFVRQLASGQAALQLVRLDGQGVQTLYCSATYPLGTFGISHVQWSLDQKSVIFMDGDTISNATTYLLNLESGDLKQVQGVIQSGADKRSFLPTAWLDATHVLMQSFIPNSDAPISGVYVLDINQATSAGATPPQKLLDGDAPCFSFDTSLDISKLVYANCTVKEIIPELDLEGPSTISTSPIAGGAPQSVLTAPTAIRMVRTVTRGSILYIIGSTKGDMTQNGVWRADLDGQGIKKIAAVNAPEYATFNEDALDYVSNFSRDGNFYAVKTRKIDGTDQQTIWYGATTGGDLVKVGIFPGGHGSLKVVGWSRL